MPAGPSELDTMEFPSEELFSDCEDLAAAMLQFAQYAQREDKAYLCAWAPWQRFGSRVRGYYPTSQPAPDALSKFMSDLRYKCLREVFGDEWDEAVSDSMRLWRSLGAVQAPPPPVVPAAGGQLPLPTPPDQSIRDGATTNDEPPNGAQEDGDGTGRVEPPTGH